MAALAVGVVGLQRPPHGDLAELARGWASTLAQQVKEDEQRQWRQLIGDDTQRINLTFNLRPELARSAMAPAAAGRLFEGTPTFPDVAAYYRMLHPRRLVVTGGAGAGKTVLVIELMLALIESREEWEPVPVRLSLAEWDTTIPLPEWLAHHLVDVYDWPAEMADELVRQRRVLPVLDGLDEMDPTAADGAPYPNARRAQAALDALNAYQDGRTAGPVILTCRTRHYKALGRRARLLDAARINIDHVAPATAHAYLMQRVHDLARWQPLLDALRSHPTGTLATTLSTPWRLSLAATVYGQRGDPSDMLRHPTRRDLDEHLLARFVRAATALHPRPRRTYDANAVHRWLAELASYILPRADLHPHQLWPLAGPRRVCRTDTLITALVVLLPLPLACASSALPGIAGSVALTAAVAGSLAARSKVGPPKRVDWRRLCTKAGGRDLILGVIRGLTFGLVLGLAFGLLLGLMSGPASGLAISSVVVSVLVLHIWLYSMRVSGCALPPTNPGLGPGALFGCVIQCVCVFGLALALALGLIFWFTGGSVGAISNWLAFALEFGLAVGLALGLLTAITHGSSSTKPRQMIRNDLMCGIVGGLAFGLAGGLTFGVAFGAAGGLAFGLAFGAAGGLTGGLIGGPAGDFSYSLYKLELGGAAGRRYLAFLLCTRGKLPRRLGVFLDWACTAGLLRFAGAAYQFRHRELQQWLARNPGPPPV